MRMSSQALPLCASNELPEMGRLPSPGRCLPGDSLAWRSPLTIYYIYLNMFTITDGLSAEISDGGPVRPVGGL
jgi:hypothetical protein